MPPPSGTRFGPYEITIALGAGGMGEVYKARDTRLDRVVALKVLPTHLAADAEARARFDREARAIAALNHPNICTLFDVGVTDAGSTTGVAYLVMELLEGETLQRRLMRGPIDLAALIDHAVALADALDTAHAAGLIHRDLKPGNIFLTSRGAPKILDFGLARAIDAADEATGNFEAVTTVGSTVGTLAYMSPEQLRAETLDARTDLFSLGLVIYEMATGQRAFQGATSAVVSAAILGEEPVRPGSMRADLPPAFEETLLKTLEKDRNLRCQSAAELRADLLRIKRKGVSDTGATTVAYGKAAAPLLSNVPLVAVTSDRPGFFARFGLVIGILGLLVVGGAAGWYYRTCCAAPTIPPALEARAAPTSPVARPAPAPVQPVPPPEPPAIPSPASRGDAVPGARGSNAPVTRGERPHDVPDAPGQDTTLAARGRAGRSGRGLVAAGRGVFGPALANLTSTLAGLPPETCQIVTAPDPRPRNFAIELEKALASAGWTCTIGGDAPGEAPVFAMQVPRSTRSSMALSNWARRLGFDPAYRVIPRLNQIRIVVGVLGER